jgi:hypothetical protein
MKVEQAIKLFKEYQRMNLKKHHKLLQDHSFQIQRCLRKWAVRCHILRGDPYLPYFHHRGQQTSNQAQ